MLFQSMDRNKIGKAAAMGAGSGFSPDLVIDRVRESR
jgi:hypothetical protein